MPKKRQHFKSFKPTPSAASSTPASASSSADKPNRSVNELLADLRRTSLRSSPSTSLPTNTPSVPPAIREILQIPETPAPAPRRPLRQRFDGTGRRLPAGPPPPRSWVSRRRDDDPSKNGPLRWDEQTLRPTLSPLPGASLPQPGSLIDLVLQRIALDWDIHQVYNKYHLFFIPSHLKSALIRYVSMTSPDGLSLDDLKAILLPPADGYEQEELDSYDAAYEALTYIDLSGALGRSLRLKEVGSLLFPTSQNAGTDEPQDSWDAADTSPGPPRELLPNLSHLSLAVSPVYAHGVSWRQLLSLAPKLSAVTHLSLAFWPDPCLTPNARFSSVTSPQGRSIPYGGTTLYSHSLDHDWNEALLVLRMLSRLLYKLEFLDLTGFLLSVEVGAHLIAENGATTHHHAAQTNANSCNTQSQDRQCVRITMGRRLPWKKTESNTSPTVAVKSETPISPARQQRPAPHTPRSVKRRRAAGDDALRSPSTSPPPAPPPEKYGPSTAPCCPPRFADLATPSFMIGGPLADDRYRMVEDEFLHTAQRFTNHLHRAEYSRLKLAAKSQNAAAIREIERPVVGRVTAEASRRHQALRRADRQSRALQDAGNEQGGGGDLPWIGTSLQGLMEGPTRDSTPIPRAAGPLMTRAAAGFGSHSASAQRQNSRPADRIAPAGSPLPSSRIMPVRATQDGRQPSFAASRSSPIPTALHRAAGPGPSVASPSGLRETPTRVAQGFHSSSSTSKLPRGKAEPSERNLFENEERDVNDEDDDDPFGVRKRKLNREKSREQLRRPEQGAPSKKASRDTIPSFL
ncbi:hypothetical protein HJFPF1_00618 [Paramyrothecium foliicola]|nr:hypothetical protein HJFPF1_00618 [Paramyrothecium foliicola]